MATNDDVNGPVNIGDQHKIPIRGSAERVIRLTGSSSKLLHLPWPRMDPTQRCPNITLAEQTLGWRPK